MRLICCLIFSLFLSFACKNDKSQKLPTVNVEVDTAFVKEPKKIIPGEIDCAGEVNVNLSSQLLCKVKGLEVLKSNYQLIKHDSVHVDNSVLFKGIKRLEKLAIKVRVEDEVDSLHQLTQMVSEVNFCLIKGTTDLGGKLYPRARIEELVFKSENCAAQFVGTLNEAIGNSKYLKELFDKSPHSIFKEKNSVYYVSSGGFYMVEIYEEIEKSIRKVSCKIN